MSTKQGATKLLTLKVLFVGVVMMSMSALHSAPFQMIGKHDGLQEIEMPGDGSCLFWAIAAGINHIEGKSISNHLCCKKDELREKVISALKSGSYEQTLSLFLISDETPYQNKESYIQALESDEWGGELEIFILSELLGTNIIVHEGSGIEVSYPDTKDHPKTLHVKYNGIHYNFLKS